MKNNLKGSLILFLAALIWGISFVSQSVGMDYVGPFTFIGIRTTMGGLVLLPFIFITIVVHRIPRIILFGLCLYYSIIFIFRQCQFDHWRKNDQIEIKRTN